VSDFRCNAYAKWILEWSKDFCNDSTPREHLAWDQGYAAGKRDAEAEARIYQAAIAEMVEAEDRYSEAVGYGRDFQAEYLRRNAARSAIRSVLHNRPKD